jgi:nucleoside phosphorylase
MRRKKIDIDGFCGGFSGGDAFGNIVVAQGTVNTDSSVKSTGNDKNHEVQEGDGRK